MVWFHLLAWLHILSFCHKYHNRVHSNCIQGADFCLDGLYIGHCSLKRHNKKQDVQEAMGQEEV